MKKFNILAALAAFAMLVTSFTGCVTAHPDAETLVDLSTFKVRGNIDGTGDWSGAALTAESDGTYTFSFTAKENTANFAIDDGAWAVTYRGDSAGNLATYELDKDITLTAKNDPNCPSVAVVPGNNYKITATPASTTISIKIEMTGSNSDTIVVNNSVASYDGSAYSYEFEAAATTEEFVVLNATKSKYYKSSADIAANAENADTVTAVNEVEKVKVTGLTTGSKYILKLAIKDNSVKISCEAKAVVYYIVGDILSDNKRSAFTVADDKKSESFSFTWNGTDFHKWGTSGDVFAFQICSSETSWDNQVQKQNYVIDATTLKATGDGDDSLGNPQIKGLQDGDRVTIKINLKAGVYDTLEISVER